MPWYTDDQIRSVPAFAGIGPDQLPQLVADASAIYSYLQGNPGVDDDALRSWGEAAGIPPERFNLATAALSQLGKAVDVTGSSILPSGPAPASLRDVVGGQVVPVEPLTVKELQTVAKRLKLDVPKSATKAELAAAIAGAPGGSSG